MYLHNEGWGVFLERVYIGKMPKRKGYKENKPTYKSKLAALRHGYITYGRRVSGARKFRVYKVKGGWNVMKK